MNMKHIYFILSTKKKHHIKINDVKKKYKTKKKKIKNKKVKYHKSSL